jgi:hypothetical protein
MTAIAAHLGCSPIIFHGVDFAFSSKMYTDHIREDHDKDHLSVVSITPDHLKTKHDWIMASDWLKEFISANHHIEFISTSMVDSFCSNKSPLSTTGKEAAITGHILKGPRCSAGGKNNARKKAATS